MQQDASWLHNFAPLSALALCGAIYFPRRLALALPFGALLVSDLILDAKYDQPFFSLEIIPHYLALAMVAALGWMLRRNPRVPLVLGASVLGSAFFFFLTNTASWLGEKAYAKTLAGWTQALTTGLPNVHPTTLEFFRNTPREMTLPHGAFRCLHGGAARRGTDSCRILHEPALWR